MAKMQYNIIMYQNGYVCIFMDMKNVFMSMLLNKMGKKLYTMDNC